MSDYRRRTVVVWVLAGAMLALAGPHLVAQQEFSSANKKRGKAVVEYRDKAAHVVAAYNYSQRNHDSHWIVIQVALSTRKETTIQCQEIALRTPQGREIPLATQTRIGEVVKRVEQLLQNAKVQAHDVASYF
jgi:HAMP domain-containing protein